MHHLSVGYQAEGSLGCVLLGGRCKNIRLFGEEICVKRTNCTHDGISGHADRAGFSAGCLYCTCFNTCICCSWRGYCHRFIWCISFDNYLWITATAPYTGESWDLLSDQKIREGTRESVKKDYQPREGSDE